MNNNLLVINELEQLLQASGNNIFRPVDTLPQKKQLVHFSQSKLISRSDLYHESIEQNFAYLMKSRPDIAGNEPIWPLSKEDYQEMVEFEKYKFQQMGVQKNDSVSIVFFSINHTIPMCQALMELGVRYVVLEGTENAIFSEIIQKKLDVIFMTVKQLEKFIHFVEKNKLNSHLRIIITAGEKIEDLSGLRKKVKTSLNAHFIDSIGSRELGGFSYTCSTHDYYHFVDRHQFIEVIDPDTAKSSSHGELVVTPLWRKDFSLIRFRTGDIIDLEEKTCLCDVKNDLVFRGITTRVDNSTKIAFGLVNVEEVYQKTKHILHHQYFFDKYLWRFLPELQSFLIVTDLHGKDELLFLVDRLPFHVLLRRIGNISARVKKIATIAPQIIFVDKKLIYKLKELSYKKQNFMDLRLTIDQQKIIDLLKFA